MDGKGLIMDLRMLQALQRAVPILLRHLDGYIELAEQDWAVAKVTAKQRLRTGAVLLTSALFTLLSVYVLIIAVAWDTPYRLPTIGGLAMLSLAVSIGAGMRFKRRREDAFSSVRREWERDRAVVHRLLTDSHLT